MLGRLQAEERLARINDGALAAGNLKDDAAGRLISGLEQRAHGSRRRAAKASPAQLAAMGIGVVMAPASSSPAVGEQDTPASSSPAVGGQDG